MKTQDRTGQVWVDRMKLEDVFVVVGAPQIDHEGDMLHPVLILASSDAGFTESKKTDWYEFHDLGTWEEDDLMERLV